jgi:RNA polymerase sigma factor (TIGR02999 family)
MADVNVTQILSQIEDGDPTAADRLLPLVYKELRKLAVVKLAQEKPGQTLQATALVHDAYLRLVDADKTTHWDSRGHFFAAAAEAMRRILVDNARRKASIRRGAGMHRQFLDEDKLAAPSDPDSLLDLNDALSELTTVDAQAAEIVKLRFFAGLTMDEAAAVLGMSTRNAYYTWTYARSWLHKKLREM